MKIKKKEKGEYRERKSDSISRFSCCMPLRIYTAKLLLVVAVCLSDDARASCWKACESGRGRSSRSAVGRPWSYTFRSGAWLEEQAFSLAYINSDSVLENRRRPETSRPMESCGEAHMNMVQCRAGIAPYTV